MLLTQDKFFNHYPYDILQRGTLVIIDRKKDIFKLSQGEYIAPEKVESVYARLDQIAHIFVEGRGDQV